ncbi:MAG: hypothetical protein Q4D21_06465 [Phascolarctobacterium sp.]|nr:hypothetical protein [Phascolarctobacterium sp.]
MNSVFVAVKAGKVEYYQVSETTLNPETLKRELATFKKINDNYPKFLLTLDNVFDTMNYEGVQKLNALQWLLS